MNRDTASGPAFDIVIPAHNAGSTIGDQLDALRRDDHADLREVLVVDSRSTDRTAAVVAAHAERWPKVRLLRVDKPGANTARNAGIAAGTSPLVLLCDADDVAAAGWARALSHSLRTYELARGRYSLELLNDEGTIAARGPLASTGPPPTTEVIGGLGGNCGFHRRVWEQLGGLSEAHVGSDDVEFFWRAALAGGSITYVDAAVIHYRLRPGYRSLFRQQRAWAANRPLLYKEFGTHRLILRRSLRSAVRQWTWIMVHARDARSADPAQRGRWVRAVATATGHLEGSVRHRVWFP